MEVKHTLASAKRTVKWSGSTDSEPIHVEAYTAGALLELPAAFTGLSVKYKVRSQLDPDDWITLQKAGSDVSDTVAAGQGIHVLTTDLRGIRELKIVSSASETATGILHLTS